MWRLISTGKGIIKLFYLKLSLENNFEEIL